MGFRYVGGNVDGSGLGHRGWALLDWSSLPVFSHTVNNMELLMAGLLMNVGVGVPRVRPIGGIGCIGGADFALWVAHWYSSERECGSMW